MNSCPHGLTPGSDSNYLMRDTGLYGKGLRYELKSLVEISFQKNISWGKELSEKKTNFHNYLKRRPLITLQGKKSFFR
jgi:hypothetical protein